MQAVPPRRAADSCGFEHRTFQENSRSCRGHFARLAAHHAGQRDGLFRVGDDQVVGAQLPLLAVQGYERLALARTADDDFFAGELVEIEPVQRVAELEQREVGRVDDVADRPHAAGPQTLLYVQWRGAYANALDQARDVTRAPLRILVVHAGRHFRIARRRGWRRADGHTGQGRQFARDPEVAQRVRPVGRDIHFEDGVRQPEQLVEQSADPRFARQNHQARMVLGKAQLALRAEHARALHTPQLRAPNLQSIRQLGADTRHRHHVAGSVVLRAANDLMSAGAVVDLADAEVIAAGDRLGLDDPGRHHAGPDRARLAALDLQAGEGQLASDLVVRERDRAQLAQPANRDLHNCSRNRASLSKSARRSSMPCRSMARRSIPTPNAYPVTCSGS